MRDLNKKYLKSRLIVFEELSKYGFKKVSQKYVYKKDIQNGDFSIIIEIENQKAFSKVIDNFENLEYALVDVEESSGNFVGIIKEEYENLIEDFVAKCTILDAFKESSSKQITKYVRNKYNDELEFLWDDYDGAVFRNKQNKKWYGVIMKVKIQSFVNSTIKRMKIDNMSSSHELLNRKKYNDEETIELIDVHIDKNNSKKLIDYEEIFPGYHMNKKSWITIILDNNTNMDKLFKLIDDSYKLAIKS